MGRLLVSKRMVKENKALKDIQKNYLKAHRHIRGRYPRVKLGKVVELVSNEIIDCTINMTADSNKIENNNQEKNNGTNINVSKALGQTQIWEKIRKADIRGLSGSGFPTIKKLEMIKDTNVSSKFFIINAVACDLGLVHDAWLLKNHLKEIEKGIESIKQLIHFDKVIIASPENVPSRYPMGEERILIKQLLGTELTKEEIPAQKGYLILNVQTVYTIYKAIYEETNENTPSRLITVANIETGRAKVAKVAKVAMEQSIKEIIKILAEKSGLEIEGKLSKSDQIFVGMGIMEADVLSDEMKVSAETGFIGFGKAAKFDNTAKCKGCGACSRRCPKGVKVRL